MSKTFDMPVLHRIAILLAPLLFGCACGGPARVRPYPKPPVDDVLADLRARQADAASFQSESTMDYWVGKERVKGTVLLLGKPGRRLRFNAENPTGGNVAVDLACDGVGYKLIDYNNNCQLVGPCTRDTIADFLNVDLEPDDFYLLATGSAPIIAGADATLEWDAQHGHETLELESRDGLWRQTVVLDAVDERWDVLSSVVYDKRGDVEWKLQNKGFHDVDAADGKRFRVPRKTRFEQPKRKADLLVVWKQHQFNLELDPGKFTMTIPDGLTFCE